jgi:Holliday junction resolvase RusA-like endonuclease
MRDAEFLFRVPLMSKARPRSAPGGGRPYMPQAYMKWKSNLRGLMGEWWTIPPLENVSALILTFSGPARGDLDNLAGAVLDSGNDLIWTDDRVNVVHAIAARWKHCKPADSSIYMKIIWEDPT